MIFLVQFEISTCKFFKDYKLHMPWAIFCSLTYAFLFPITLKIIQLPIQSMHQGHARHDNL